MSRVSAVHRVSGIVAQLVTPFTADAAVDTGLMRSLIDRMITAGVDAIELLGATSESAPLFATIAGYAPPAAIKSGLRTLGIEAGDPRLPQQPLDKMAGTELAELIAGMRSR